MRTYSKWYSNARFIILLKRDLVPGVERRSVIETNYYLTADVKR